MTSRIRYMKCFNCGYPTDGQVKIVQHEDIIWRGEYCPKCGRRLRCTSSPKPKTPRPV